MTDHITNVRRELKRTMQTIPGLRVLDHTPDTWNDFPLAVVRFTRVQVGPTLGGSGMSGEITITLMTGGTNLAETLPGLDSLIKSVDDALTTDPTLSGTVHYIVLDRMENIGVRNIGPHRTPAADLHLRFLAG